MVQDQVEKVDILIIGAGIVGLTLCNALLKSGCRVGIVDKKIPKEGKFFLNKKNQAWVSALARPGQRLFEEIGIWEKLSAYAVPYIGMDVAACSGEKIEFSHRDIGQSNLGHIVNNPMIAHLLWQVIAEWGSQVTVFEDEPVSWCAVDGKLALRSGKQCRTTLLIGADGAQSWTRNACGIDVKANHMISDHAHIGLVRHDYPHENRARQVFYASGVIGLLPTSHPEESICVWSVANKDNQDRDLHDIDDIHALTTHLNRAFASAQYHLEGQWVRHTIQCQQACRYVGEKAVLVGDAATSVHPLAGQGLNIGLRQVKVLAGCITTAFKANHLEEFSDYGQKYQSACRGYDLLSQQVISWCRQSMTAKGVMQNILALGARLLNSSSTMKRLMIRHALEGNMVDSKIT